MAVRLFALTCGWLTGPAGGFLAGATGRLRVPVPAFLIDHPAGKVLFDSGLHPDAGRDPQTRLGPAAHVFEVELRDGEDVAARQRMARFLELGGQTRAVELHLGSLVDRLAE